MEHVRQPRPGYGLGVQVQGLLRFQVVSSPLGRSLECGVRVVLIRGQGLWFVVGGLRFEGRVLGFRVSGQDLGHRFCGSSFWVEDLVF